MIDRLKRSFITITMISAALVLALLMGVVNLANYIQRRNYDREILAYLVENGGNFPGSDSPSDEPSPASPRGNEGGRAQPRLTEETPFETRYYSVALSDSGEVLHVNTRHVAAISAPEAEDAARALQAEGKTSGRLGPYRYLGAEIDGGVLYVFLDCSRSFIAVRSLMLNSAAVTAAGLVALYLILWLTSGRAVRPMAESYEKQREFITNAGHELKTPLAVIESSTEVIEMETGESQWTRSVHEQVGRLTALTQELTALARMDEDKSSLTVSELDISEIVSQSLAPYETMAAQRGLGFQAGIAPGVRMSANREAMEKLCGILADNAIKYTVPGGTIRFELVRSGGHILLREENPAEGLSQGRLEKLFDRFYRADSSRSSAQHGYGLGLSLARSLTEAMGGKITAESPDGKRFILTAQFPAAKSARP